jgi:hypothetical protein
MQSQFDGPNHLEANPSHVGLGLDAHLHAIGVAGVAFRICRSGGSLLGRRAMVRRFIFELA